MIDPRSVETFYWVVRLGGFRRAAERLGTTQPAVSARVAGLEAATGVVLLERGRRRAVRLTAAGTLMLQFAERQLALAAEMAAAFGAGKAVRGRVRLGVAETLVHTWLSVLLRRLHLVHPGLAVDVLVDVSVKLRAGLLAGEVDVALLLGPVAAPGVRDAFLCAYPLAFVVGPGLALEPGPLGAEALARFPLITYPRETAPHQQLLRALAAMGGGGGRVFGNASLSSLVRMVLDGIGVGVVAPAAIGAVLAEGGLRVVEGVAGLLPDPLHFTASWREGPGGAAAAAVARMAIEVAQGERGDGALDRDR